MSEGDDLSHLSKTEERKSKLIPTGKSLTKDVSLFGRLAGALTGDLHWA
jgi:hypothetical protein